MCGCVRDNVTAKGKGRRSEAKLTIAEYDFVLLLVKDFLVLGVVLDGLAEQMNKDFQETDIGSLRGECLSDELIPRAEGPELRVPEELAEPLPEEIHFELRMDQFGCILFGAFL